MTTRDFQLDLQHRVGVMRALLPYLPQIIATKSAAPLRQSTMCAMKEGALIAMRSLLLMLGAKVSGGKFTLVDPADPSANLSRDCPTNPKGKDAAKCHVGQLVKCRWFTEAELALRANERDFIETIARAGTQAVAHLTNEDHKLDHDVDEEVLEKAIIFLSREVKERVFDENGWSWDEVIAKPEQEENAEGRY